MKSAHNSGCGTHGVTRALAVFGAGALLLHAWRLERKLFGRKLALRFDPDGGRPVDDENFPDFVAAITDATVHRDTRVSVYTNGDEFYPAELQAIEAAKHTVNLEMYEFLKGDIGNRFLAALTARARAGVEVRLVIDALGSFGLRRSYFAELERAGGRVAWYHPVDWREWPYLNTRTHRKLLVVDGRGGFIGGAGVADHWARATGSGPRWRDTMLRIEGVAASSLNATFVENWVACTCEVLAGRDDFALAEGRGNTPSMVITSGPGGGATRARLLYQALLASATRTVDITTPYFVPDRSARETLLRALKDRSVRVRILTAGPHSDHAATRRLGRMMAAGLVRAGAEFYEYQPSMIHAKLMTVDGIWTVAGSTNFDHRSFELNDEVSIAMFDRAVAENIREDFDRDLAESVLVTERRLHDQSFSERALGELSWLVRREQ
jgi:cardiolipin synthase